jgi:hypothetical protein
VLRYTFVTPQGNAVVELNALKLAEDRTFADLSRYIFTALLALALPPSAEVHPDNVMLYATEVPECDKVRASIARLHGLNPWIVMAINHANAGKNHV